MVRSRINIYRKWKELAAKKKKKKDKLTSKCFVLEKFWWGFHSDIHIRNQEDKY